MLTSSLSSQSRGIQGSVCAFIFWNVKSPKSLSKEGSQNSPSLLRMKGENNRKTILALAQK